MSPPEGGTDTTHLDESHVQVLDQFGKDSETPPDELMSIATSRHEAKFVYKKRTLTGNLLHFTVNWTAQQVQKGKREEAEFVLNRLLECRADLRETAEYTNEDETSGETKGNKLEAIHIAAGRRCVAALKILVKHAREQGIHLREYVNACCELEFYTPLHDASYFGQAYQKGDVRSTIEFLLKYNADPLCEDKNGYTPLHWLAQIGFNPASELEEVVRLLLKHRARLDVKTRPLVKKEKGEEGEEEREEGKIPLQLAASETSSFSRRLMYLLAPSIHFVEEAGSQGPRLARTRSAMFQPPKNYSVFDDLCLLACHNTAAAESLAKQLADYADFPLLKKIRQDAQRHNAVDRVAQLFHMAPEAAARMLELLLVAPKVVDPSRHPIPMRARLVDFFHQKPMHCAYEPDPDMNGDKQVVENSPASREEAKAEAGDLKVPRWNFDSDKEEAPPWHAKLVVVPENNGELIECMEDVDTGVLLLPNILDIDIFMALASMKPSHFRIFTTVPVQGIIYCLWDHLIVRPLYVRIVADIIGVCVMYTWGVQDSASKERTCAADAGGQTTGSCAKDGRYSSADTPLLWTILAASLFRDLSILINRAYSHWRKLQGHLRKYRRWYRRSKLRTSSKEPDLTGRSPFGMGKNGTECEQDTQRPPSLHALWKPGAFLSWEMLVLEAPLYMCKALFVSSTYAAAAAQDLTERQEQWLAASMWLQCMRLIYTVRLTVWGKKVTTIMKTFFSGAIFGMLVVVFLSFMAVLLACKMLHCAGTTAELTLELYKGLLSGDVGALDTLANETKGFDSAQGDAGDAARTVVVLCAIVLFNICMLNLIIAIYSSEYERLDQESDQHFLRERASSCCDFLLGLPRIPGGLPREKVRHSLVGLCLIGALCCMASAHAVAALCIAAAQVLLQAYLMDTPWFPWRGVGEGGDVEEGPAERHYLWLCCGSGCNPESSGDAGGGPEEDTSDAQESPEDGKKGKGGRALQARYQELANQNEALQKQNEELREQVSALDEKLDRVLERLDWRPA